MPTSTLPLVAMLLVRIGQSLFLAGSVRSKNGAGIALRMLLDLAIVVTAVWAFGAAFVPNEGADRIFTPRNLFGIDPEASKAIGLVPMILIATGAIYGAIAERARLAPMILLSLLLSALMPLWWQMAARLDVPDRGIGIGSVAGGAAALAAAMVVGPRKGKFNRDQSVNFVPGHNVVLQLVGVLTLFVSFAAISFAPEGLLICASLATLASACFGYLRFGKIDTGLTIAGAIGGLCAGGGAGHMPTYYAAMAGVSVGLLVPWILMKVEVSLRVDDVTASSATHLVAGFIGMFVALADHARNVEIKLLQCVALVLLLPVAAAALGLAVMLPFRFFGKLRVSEQSEFDGSDLSELDVNAYPDFQQTMIKSYHLREL